MYIMQLNVCSKLCDSVMVTLHPVRARIENMRNCDVYTRQSAASRPARPKAHFMTTQLPLPLTHRYVQRSLPHAQAASKGSPSVLETARQLTRDEKRDAAYREGAVYLRALGIDSQTDLTRVLDIAMNPNSLFVDNQSKLRPGNDSARLLSVEADIKPVVEYLTSLGLNYNQVVLAHPPVISYSPTERLTPFMQSLESMGVSDPIEVVLRRPSLLGLSNRDNLSRIVSYLLDSGHSLEEVTELLATSV